jgi:UDP-2,4-diacetamido-2,4,6-trideoxy-beta-L-altropyranose hydrolase
MAGRRAVKPPLALFRCDASPAIGAGHVTRCLALAEALVDSGWRVAFAAARATGLMVPAIAAEDFAASELPQEASDEPAALRSQFPAGVDLLVVDHYERDAAFERPCRGWAKRILVMADGTGRQHDCDLLVDSGAGDHSAYAGRVPAYCRLLLGPRYALVRRSFVTQRPLALRRRDGAPVREILVSFGASDPQNATAAALAALAVFSENIAITVALSSRAPHIENVREQLRSRDRLVLDGDMAQLMTDADLAVGAGGASAFERAVLGLPSILLTLADNQRGISKLLACAGAAVDAGQHDASSLSHLQQVARALINDAAARMGMSEAASRLIDGRAAQRALVTIAGETLARDGSLVRLRLAEAHDEGWLLELQRAPQTRQYFRNPSIPTPEEHASWMRRSIAHPDSCLCIIDIEGDNAGTIRLDRHCDWQENAAFEVSVALDSRFYGRGIASAALSLARRLQPTAFLHADILPGNVRSKALFTSAGYVRVGPTGYRQDPNSVTVAHAPEGRCSEIP